jgi:hypothetical protein
MTGNLPAKLGTPIAVVLAIVAFLFFLITLFGCTQNRVTIPMPPVEYPSTS